MKHIFLIVVIASLISGCVDTAHWTEEVKLHDGKTIEVERKISRHKFGFPNAPRGSIIDSELIFKPLNIRWSGENNNSLISFEIFDGIAYLTIFNDDRDFCNHNKKGTYKATYLKYENSVWVEIDQPNFPTNLALQNLYLSYWGHSTDSDANGLITWSKKAIKDGFNSREPETIETWYQEDPYRICDF